VLLASSRYATDLLQRAPEGVRMLGSDEQLAPLGLAALRKEMTAGARRHSDPVDAVTAVRAIRRRELFRISAADLFGLLDVEAVGYALTDVMTATLDAALLAASAAVEAERRGPLPTRLAVVAMGRFGGDELGFGSDADVMFVHEPLPDAQAEDAARAARDVANEFRRLLSLPGTDPALSIDADLRPEGKQGPLVRTLESYAAYYAKWSVVWEAQALLRAKASVGDEDLARRFTELIDPLRFPADGISDDDVREVRRIKARVDDERLPRGADKATHLKLGRGGLADVEWTIQLLQMQHSGRVEGLRTTRTLDALKAAVDAGLLEPHDALALSEAWRTASGLRNAITQVRGRPADSLPRDTREKAAVASIRGYPPGRSEDLINDYLRVTRRARAVVERLFWG
jgi:glutamate-ammonia-ligase adenylyltransferase